MKGSDVALTLRELADEVFLTVDRDVQMLLDGGRSEHLLPVLDVGGVAENRLENKRITAVRALGKAEADIQSDNSHPRPQSVV